MKSSSNGRVKVLHEPSAAGFEFAERAFLITAHEPIVAGHVSGQDRCEPNRRGPYGLRTAEAAHIAQCGRTDRWTIIVGGIQDP